VLSEICGAPRSSPTVETPPISCDCHGTPTLPVVVSQRLAREGVAQRRHHSRAIGLIGKIGVVGHKPLKGAVCPRDRMVGKKPLYLRVYQPPRARWRMRLL
jgi:hypothetical protein